MVAAVVEDLLGAADGERRFGGDGLRYLADAVRQFVRRGELAVDQAETFGLLAVDVAAGIGQFARHAFADQAGQALQGADVGHHADVDFLDRKHRVGRSVAHVAAGDEIEAAAHTGSVDGGNDRLAAAFEAVQAVLQVEDQAAQGLAAARPVWMGNALLDTGQHAEVDAGAEIPAGAAQDGDTGLWCGIQPVAGLADFLPHGIVEGVRFVRPVEADFGDVVGEADLERAEGG